MHSLLSSHLMVMITTGGLVDTGSRAHGSLNVEGLDVLPVLLEEGHEEVDTQHGVGNEFVIRMCLMMTSEARKKS